MRQTTIRQNQASNIDLDAIKKLAGNDRLSENDVFDFGTFVIARSGLNRNHSDITPEAQKSAVKNWIGKAILFHDHESNSANQIGRIYEAWTEDRDGETVTLGKGFGIKTDDHKDIFARIENRIHSEMSCAYEPIKSICSACNADLVGFSECPNGHAIGKDAHIMDVEFLPDHISFVGRPAVVGAGLIAAEAEQKVLRIFGLDSIDEAEQTVTELRRDAEDGKEFRAFARTEFIKWHRMVLDNPWATNEIESLADKLTAKEMIRLARIDKDRFHSVIPDGKQMTEASNKNEVESSTDDEPISLHSIAEAMKG